MADMRLTENGDENVSGLAQVLRNMGLTDKAKIRTFVESKDPNRRLNYMLFEYAVAIKYGAQTWASISPDIKKAWRAPIADNGIDCIGDNFKHAIQAKWCKPKACISFTSVATFFTLGTTVGATRFTIVTSEKVTISKSSPQNVEHAILSNAEFIDVLSAAVCGRDELKEPIQRPGVEYEAPHVIEHKVAPVIVATAMPAAVVATDATQPAEDIQNLHNTVRYHMLRIKSLFRSGSHIQYKDKENEFALCAMSHMIEWHILHIEYIVSNAPVPNDELEKRYDLWGTEKVIVVEAQHRIDTPLKQYEAWDNKKRAELKAQHENDAHNRDTLNVQ
jgi:hypothetical protein